MAQLLESLGTALDLALVVLGFGALIVVHELGHFLAARWAGIRVLAFAVGMGPALVSWRKGLGWRRGSSEREYQARLGAAPSGLSAASSAPPAVHGISPTEYRLNVLPLGGYVKMLGQEDSNPGAVSDAPDSYQRCPVWKRMVVISAGVVANVVTAACIFIAVFRVGLPTEAPVIGDVAPGSAAALAVAGNAGALGVSEPGLRPGDRVLDIDGSRPDTFSDLTLATAMAPRNEPILLKVARDGVPEPLRFAVMPKVAQGSGLLELGVEPARTARVITSKRASEREKIGASLGKGGLPGVRPGMLLTRIGDSTRVRGAEDLERAARNSGGRPFDIVLTDAGGSVTVPVVPRAEMQLTLVKRPEGTLSPQRHVLGLTPVLRVESTSETAERQGLREGDVFVRIGTLEYPSVTAGIAEIRAHAGRALGAVVRRARADGTAELVELKLKVGSKGTVGFYAGDTADVSTELALPPGDGEGASTAPARGVVTVPGSRVIRVAGTPVATFTELREALRAAVRDAAERGGAEAEVTLELESPSLAGGKGLLEARTMRVAPAEARALLALSWTSPVNPGAFELEQTLLKAGSAGEALRMGVRETHRVMMSVYTTFARLFEQTVKIEHLKGPVGIAHLGTRIADRGVVWLMFFLGLISANLAVINFLPLPIVDGGQFLFLVAEAVRGRPVPLAVQNVATIVGLVLIGSMFLVVTFNDVVGLFGG